jgi:hypothetical protein
VSPFPFFLPELGVYQKDFPDPKNSLFIVRSLVLSYFQVLESYDVVRSNSKKK